MGAGILVAVHQARRAADGNDFPEMRAMQIVGQYHLQIGTIPGTIQVGHGHLAVDVRTAARLPSASGAVSWRAGRGPQGPVSEQAVPNAQVRILATGPDGLRAGPFLARNSATEPEYYDAPLDLPHAGLWHLVISVRGPLGPAHIALPLRVRNHRPAWGTISGWLLWLSAALAVILLNLAERRGADAA